MDGRIGKGVESSQEERTKEENKRAGYKVRLAGKRPCLCSVSLLPTSSTPSASLRKQLDAALDENRSNTSSNRTNHDRRDNAEEAV